MSLQKGDNDRARTVVIVGGGAAGFFAAIACAEANPKASITVLEKSSHFLSKVRISGGGRCNVTHACFDARELSAFYPRGGKELIGLLHRFQPRDTFAWFRERGVELKTEPDGRVFPVTDSSQTILDCFLRAAKELGINTLLNCGVDSVRARHAGGFELALSDGRSVACECLMLATGGCRGERDSQLPASLGHTIETPVPSLFSFHIKVPWLRGLAGISLEQVEASIPDFGLKERGSMLITHEGLSGPVILRLSAWGARALHGANYSFPTQIHWLPGLGRELIQRELESRRGSQPARLIVNSPVAPLPARLWEQLVLSTGISRETRWADLARAERHRLVEQLVGARFEVTGKSLNKEEFVTCGGVPLKEVDLRSMQSRICPRLFFGGEALDIDGLTGGFNFQAAWTTGWIAGRSMAQVA